jgi:hypothetical protein
MLPFLVTRAYGAPSAWFGYLLAAGGAAATVAALVVGSRRPPRRPLATSYGCYAIGLAAVAGLGVAPGVLVGAVFAAAMFAATTVGNLLQDSVLGRAVPRELRGRVGSLDWVAATASAPLSVVVAAVVAGHAGIRAVFVGAGLLAAATSVLGLLLLGRTGEPAVSDEPRTEPVGAAA